jgi:hypothetical protein
MTHIFRIYYTLRSDLYQSGEILQRLTNTYKRIHNHMNIICKITEIFLGTPKNKWLSETVDFIVQ